MPTMPRVVQRPTPNYSAAPIRHDLVICHRTEGGYAGSVAWLCDPRARASAHLVMKLDGSEVTQLVPLQAKAWAQCAFNSAGISLEIEGFSAKGMATATMEAAAGIVAWLCRAYSIPPVWAKGGQGRGVCQHHDLGAAGGGHVDCFGVGSADWTTFLGLVKAAHDALDPLALPAFALHGAPGPHEVATPADAPSEPGHGGAARAEAGEVGAFPAHTLAGLQARLNALGLKPELAVDGRFGPQTRAALMRFQAAHDCDVDGLVGPETWAALDRAA